MTTKARGWGVGKRENNALALTRTHARGQHKNSNTNMANTGMRVSAHPYRVA